MKRLSESSIVHDTNTIVVFIDLILAFRELSKLKELFWRSTVLNGKIVSHSKYIYYNINLYFWYALNSGEMQLFSAMRELLEPRELCHLHREPGPIATSAGSALHTAHNFNGLNSRSSRVETHLTCSQTSFD